MNFNQHIRILLVTLLFGNTCFAQKIELAFSFNDTTLHSSKLLDHSKSIEISQLKTEIQTSINKLTEQAYLTSTVDSITIDSSKAHVYLGLGKQYKWASLSNKNIDEEILSKLGFRDKIYSKRPFNPNQLSNFFNKVITYYENNGYPFASIKLDSVVIDDNTLAAQLYVEKNKFYKIDSVIIKGDATISDQYIKNYIKIKDGDPYNEELVKKISTKIKELPFVTEQQKWKIIFLKNEAKLYLYLKKKQASRFDGILGLLPDDETGKLSLTGDVKLNLINSFRAGEKISLNWRSIQKNTQDLKFDLAYPFLFNSPFGLDYSFKLYKKDTTFIDVGNKIGARYLLKGNNYFSVFFHNKTSSLLNNSDLSTLTVLPSYADVSARLYGVGVYNENLDYTLNPKKGYSIDFSGSLGNKDIKQNPEINSELYENVNLKSNIYNAELNAQFFFSLSNRSVIKLGSKNGYTFNDNLFENELYRIGGLLTLRGFDEESIFASLYSIETIEYRLILEQNSYLFAFFDAAYYESDTYDSFVADRPFGFGAGMSFETKAGIFSISYAVGKQFDNPILFRSAKIHFGFVNFF